MGSGSSCSSVLPAGATFCGEGRPEIWTQRCWLPDVNEGTEVVHSRMLPRPPRHLEDRYCCCRALGAPNGRQTAGGGKINANLADLEGDRRGEDIAAAMATEVLEDMSEQSPMTLIMVPG